jgi:hypothetical protein
MNINKLDIINEILNNRKNIFTNLKLPFDSKYIETNNRSIQIVESDIGNKQIVKSINFIDDSIKLNTTPHLNPLISKIDVVEYILGQILSEISLSIFRNFNKKIISDNNIDYIFIPPNMYKLESEKNEIFIRELTFKCRRSGIKNIITSAMIAAEISDSYSYNSSPQNKNITNGSVYKIGSLGNIDLWVDPYMKYDDNRILGWDDVTCYVSPGDVFEMVEPTQFQTSILLKYRYFLDINYSNVTYYLKDQTSEGYGHFISEMRDKKIDELLDGRE